MTSPGNGLDDDCNSATDDDVDDDDDSMTGNNLDNDGDGATVDVADQQFNKQITRGGQQECDLLSLGVQPAEQFDVGHPSAKILSRSRC